MYIQCKCENLNICKAFYNRNILIKQLESFLNCSVLLLVVVADNINSAGLGG